MPDLTDAEIAEVVTKARDAYGLDDTDWYDQGFFDLADPADAVYAAHASPARILSLALEVQRLRAENATTPCMNCRGTGLTEERVSDVETESFVCQTCAGTGKVRR